MMQFKREKGLKTLVVDRQEAAVRRTKLTHKRTPPT